MPGRFKLVVRAQAQFLVTSEIQILTEGGAVDVGIGFLPARLKYSFCICTLQPGLMGPDDKTPAIEAGMQDLTSCERDRL